MEINLLLYSLPFVLGLSVGSFLNVLIDRLPRGEQIFKGRSYCESCKKTLAWYDLIPLFSWLVLRGRCRWCHSPIGIQYPLVEFISGALFILVFFFLSQDLLSIIYYLLFISALIVIFVADLKYQIIPDEVIFPTIALTIIFQIINHRLELIDVINPIASGLGASLFFLALVLLTRGRGMGVGDVKLAVLMGLLLGFPGILVALYLAFLTGAILGVILVLLGKKRFGQKIPFGPFLVGGTFISLFWGTALWQIFQKILGLS